MPAVISTDSFHQTSPHRPSRSDVQNGLKANDESGPPPPEAPSAEEDNHKSSLIVGFGAVVPIAIVTIEFAGGVPRVFALATVRDDDVAMASVTVTDNGPGDTSVVLPTGKFPAANARPAAFLNDTAGGNRAPSAEAIPGGARVRTSNGAGAPTDLPFTVHLWGT